MMVWLGGLKMEVVENGCFFSGGFLSEFFFWCEFQ